VNYKSCINPIWCPGCGDFGVFAAMNKAFTDLGIDKNKLFIVSGIGCSSAVVHTFDNYGIHGLHGRVLPIASGVKLANQDLTVIGAGGDGDGFGIGMGHFIHTARRNIDFTYIVMDNQIYGLTTGQASPTSLKGAKTKSSPNGVIESPINPILTALSAGATYVARGFSGDPMHLAEMIKGGIAHKGFAFIDAISPCVTFNKTNTYDWFKQRMYKIDDKNHDPSNFRMAIDKALEFGESIEKMPIGLFYKKEQQTYEEQEIALKESTLFASPLPSREMVIDRINENI